MDLVKIVLILYVGSFVIAIIRDLIQDTKNLLDPSKLENPTNLTIRDRFVLLRYFLQALLSFLASVTKGIVYVALLLAAIWFVGSALESLPRSDPTDYYDNPYR